MKKGEFEELKKQYCTITEAIALYDSGNHSEYDEDDLNEELDEIHAEICEEASYIAQCLINKIDKEGDRAKVKMTGKDLANIHYLNALYDIALNCKAYSESPELFGLTKSYGNGVIDGIGADFYIGSCKITEKRYFGYEQFFQLLEEYELTSETFWETSTESSSKNVRE